jgi:hypothetical protein
VTDRTFQLAAYTGTGLLFALLMALRFSSAPTPPRMPPAPSQPQVSDMAQLNYSQGLYRAGLEKDSADYGAPLTTVADLSVPFDHDDVNLGQELEPGGTPVETRMLRLTTRVDDLQVNTTKGSFTGKHLLLKIENKTEKYLAYRVDTSPTAPQRCMSKGDLAHDAIALAPGQSIERSECVWRDGLSFVIDHVETVALPPLSYYYVSRLYPPHVGGDTRSTRGHKPAKGQVCNDIPEQAIRRGMQKGETTWLDVVDFYARHNCEGFIFPSGYRAFTVPNQYMLPVSREAAAAGPLPAPAGSP